LEGNLLHLGCQLNWRLGATDCVTEWPASNPVWL